MSVKVHEAFSIDSFQDRLLWWDDFLGDQIKDEWDITLVGGGTATVVDAQTGGIVRLTAPTNATNDAVTLDWGDIRSLLVSKKASAEFRAKASANTQINVEFRLRFDVNNHTSFFYDRVAAGNWLIICRDGGVATSLDSGVALDTDYHVYRIECHTHGASHVHFYIDGVETGNSPITTNIPDDATDYLQPVLYLDTKEAAQKTFDIDYVVVRQEI